QRRWRQSPKRTALSNRMNNHPVERHEDDGLAFQTQLVEATIADAMFIDPPCKRDDGADVCEVVIAEVGESEHQRPPTLVRSDDGVAAETDLGGRPREAGKEEGAENREAKQSHQGFERDKHIGSPRVGDELSVADGRKRLDAEENAPFE